MDKTIINIIEPKKINRSILCPHPDAVLPISDADYESLRNSLEENGQLTPLTVMENPAGGYFMHERFIVLNADGTLRFAPYNSGPAGGNVPPDWIGKMKGSHVLHNHPSGNHPKRKGYGMSFSDSDIKAAIGQNVASMTADSAKRRYVMEPGENGWPKKRDMLKSYNRNLEIIGRVLVKRIRQGKIDFDTANTVHLDLVWKKVSKELGMKYSVTRKGI